MSKLEEMGTILMHIALQYTHPDFESMYSDWSTVHDIGEKLVKMSDQPQLNENQEIVLNWLKGRYKGGSSLFNAIQGFRGFNGVLALELNALMSLSNKEEAQVLQAFSQWAQEQEEKQ